MGPVKALWKISPNYVSSSYAQQGNICKIPKGCLDKENTTQSMFVAASVGLAPSQRKLAAAIDVGDRSRATAGGPAEETSPRAHGCLTVHRMQHEGVVEVTDR